MGLHVGCLLSHSAENETVAQQGYLAMDYRFKVAGSSLLIHAFAYSLFVGIYSIISNMTGHYHSCHSIRFIID